MPDKYKIKASRYIYDCYIFADRPLNFLNLCGDNDLFVRWISYKLTEKNVGPNIYEQIEGDRLTNIKFIQSGRFSYMIKKDNEKLYNLEAGGFFGCEDIFFAIKKTMDGILKTKNDQRGRSGRDYYSSDDSFHTDSSSDISYDVEEVESQACELVFTRPIKAKSSVKSENACLILLLDKSHLSTMQD